MIFEDADGNKDDDLQTFFEESNIQGVHPYTKTSTTHDPGLVVACGGSILFGKIIGDAVRFREIWSGWDTTHLDVWFTQGQEQLYIQNGVDRPLAWNGKYEPARELPEEEDVLEGETVVSTNLKMPTGTIMGYSHGRIAVSNSKNLIAVSDHILGAGAGSRTNMENFNENTTFLGGTFSTPSNLGQITAITPLPVSGNRNGTGDLIIFCENGAASIDLSLPREQWADAALVMVGAGCMSPDSAVAVNNDIWYRRPDGIGSLRQSRVDETSQWVDTPLSKEVANWLDRETPSMMRHVSMCYFDNRIFCTVNGVREENSFGYGANRYFQGLVVLDLHRGSTVTPDAGFGWDGLWTGPRPTQIVTLFAEGVNKMFVFSLDSDGKNRVYEMKTHEGNDLGSKKIKGFYVTKAFHRFGGGSNISSEKRLLGGGRLRVVSTGQSKISVKNRAGDYPCWTEYMPERCVGFDICKPGCVPSVSKGFYETLRAPSAFEDGCEQGSERVVSKGTSHQFMVEIEGNAKIPWMTVTAEDVPEDERSTPGDDFYCDDENADSITCCTEKDFDYTLHSE